jgi:hypothetical protein
MPLPLEPVYTQAAQAMIQQRVLAAMLADGHLFAPPGWLRLLLQVPIPHGLPA